MLVPPSVSTLIAFSGSCSIGNSAAPIVSMDVGASKISCPRGGCTFLYDLAVPLGRRGCTKNTLGARVPHSVRT